MERSNKLNMLARRTPKERSVEALLRACAKLVNLGTPREEVLKIVDEALKVAERAKAENPNWQVGFEIGRDDSGQDA
jgi:hypothetical protein